MTFGAAIGTACGAFAATNIDDVFVLVTFFAESATKPQMTALNITLGQYAGFTAITVISMIGFGISLVLPPEPIGFLGFLPLLLGWWNLADLILSRWHGGGDDDGHEGEAAQHMTYATRFRVILKVATITLINGGDNIGTYIPLFSQAKGAEIAVYVVVFYILVGVWCFAAWLVMKQRHILRIAQKYAEKVIPFLYMGLGVFIIVESHCYPWAIDHINRKIASHPGRLILALCTTAFLLVCISAIFWFKWRKRRKQAAADEADEAVEGGAGTALEEVPPRISNEGQHAEDDVSQVPEKPTTADTSVASTSMTQGDNRPIPP